MRVCEQISKRKIVEERKGREREKDHRDAPKVTLGKGQKLKEKERERIEEYRERKR